MTLREAYIKFRTDPANDEKSDSFFSTAYGFGLDDVRDMQRTEEGLAESILKGRRGKYSTRMLKIDDALIRAAESGDTKAAELVYRRFDGWNPKVVEETNNYYNFADMVKGLHKVTHIKREI